MQANFDAHLEGYNHARPHQGRGMHGRIPAQAFPQGLPRTSAKEDHAQKLNPRRPPDPAPAEPPVRQCTPSARSGSVRQLSPLYSLP
jgi:hypothetical protein